MKTMKKYVYSLLGEFPGQWKKFGTGFELIVGDVGLYVKANGRLYTLYKVPNSNYLMPTSCNKEEFAQYYKKYYKLKNFT